MKQGAEAVARALGRNLVLAFVIAALVVLFAYPQAGGLISGFLVLGALLTVAVVFGVAAAVRLGPPATLQRLGALALLGAGAAGVYAAPDTAFGFGTIILSGIRLSPGEVLVQIAASLLVAGAGGALFLFIAGRAEALVEDDRAP